MGKEKVCFLWNKNTYVEVETNIVNSRERKQEFEINGQEAAPPQMNHDSEAPGLLEGQHLDIFLLQAVIEEWVGGGVRFIY